MAKGNLQGLLVSVTCFMVCSLIRVAAMLLFIFFKIEHWQK